MDDLPIDLLTTVRKCKDLAGRHAAALPKLRDI
jgi:hypothetical protein